MKYVSCQKPVPPESRRKFCHQRRCGSDRDQRSSDSQSRQYWRMPACIGISDIRKFSCSRRPSGRASTDAAIRGPKPMSVFRPASVLTRMPR